MRRRMIVLLVTGVIAALAILAFAGYFTSDGWVVPTSGCANYQLFHFEVHYNVDEEQETPAGYLFVWDGDILYDTRMMQVTTLDGVAYYWHETGLPPNDDWGYSFETFDDSTTRRDGPTVYSCP